MSLSNSSDTHGDEALERIIWDIYLYLENHGLKKMAGFFGLKTSSLACASWTEINIQLSYFVKDPKNHYSKVMSKIEHEKSKCSRDTAYVDHLNKLENFLKSSPKFSHEYHCLVRVPDSFQKRKMKTKIGTNQT